MLKDWIYLIQLLMAAVHFIDTRTIQEIEKNKSELCTPVNISVVLTSWSPICVTLHWSCAYTQANGELFYVNLSSLKKLTKDKDRIITSGELTSFRISYSAYNSEFRFTQIVPAYINRSNLDNLQPNTKYTLTISSISTNNQVGVTSREVDFVAPAVAISNSPQFNTNMYNSIASLRLDTDDTINVKPAEVIVVVVVLCCWLYVIVFFVKKWGKYLWGIRSMEPIIGQARIRSGNKTVLDTDSLNGTSSVPTKSRLQSFANITLMPKIHMSESNNSLFSDHQSLLNSKHHLTVNTRPRLNSFFLTSPSRRDSFMPDENRLPRRYKSAEDLQSLVLEITEAQRQQRKLSQISIKEADQMHLENCTLINNLGSNVLINHSGSFTNQQYSGSNTTRGSLTTSATSRGSNGTIKLDNLATVAIAASNNQYKSRIASPSKSSSSERGIICSSSGTCTTSSANSKQSTSQNKLQYKKNSIGIQVESLDSNQATIASCERDLDQIAINCTYCRRRMSNCDECTHCNSLNMSTLTNRNLILMQSRSFINHTCSSENSSFENNPLTSSNKNLSTAGTSPSGNGHRTSQTCLFQISETSDDIKHIDEE